MLQATHLIGFGAKRAAAGGGTCTDLGNISAVGTNIGDMTGSGGLAAAFDFTTSQTFSASARKTSATSGFVGKNWGGNKNVCRFDLYGPSNDFIFDANSGTLTCKLQGSSSGVWGGEQTTLKTQTITGTQTVAQVISVTTGITAGDYAYHRWFFECSSSQSIACAEVRVWTLV